MFVLVLNCGSSTVKLQDIETDDERIAADGDRRLARGLVERIGGQAPITLQAGDGPLERHAEPVRDHRAAIDLVLRWLVSGASRVDGIRSLGDIHAVGHRVVHGGERFRRSVLIDQAVADGIATGSPGSARDREGKTPDRAGAQVRAGRPRSAAPAPARGRGGADRPGGVRGELDRRPRRRAGAALRGAARARGGGARRGADLQGAGRLRGRGQGAQRARAAGRERADRARAAGRARLPGREALPEDARGVATGLGDHLSRPHAARRLRRVRGRQGRGGRQALRLRPRAGGAQVLPHALGRARGVQPGRAQGHGLRRHEVRRKNPEKEIIALGHGKLLKSGERTKFQGKKGERVLFSSYRGTEVKIDGEEYLLMSEEDILAVIE